MKKKTFDCVEMKRQGAVIVLDRIKSMTREQELEYWQKRTKEMLRSQKQKPHHSVSPKNVR